MNITSPKEISEILAKYGLSPLKKYGQNFLCDGNVVEKIAEGSGVTKDDCVLEVGPGLGALTQTLAKRAKKVVCIEIDSGMVQVLQETLQDFDNVAVINADILKADIPKIISEHFGGENFHACGNLPYYITAKCILTLIESGAKSLTAMVQKEVADRLSSAPGSKDYGSITASVNYFGTPETLFKVSKNCFYPAPDVDSAIINIKLDGKTPDVSREKYTEIVRACFAMRRKTLYNNLLSAFGKKMQNPKEKITQILNECNIDPKSRAENLCVEEFTLLAQKLF